MYVQTESGKHSFVSALRKNNPGSSAYKQRIFCPLAQESGSGKSTASKEKLSLRQAMRKT